MLILLLQNKKDFKVRLNFKKFDMKRSKNTFICCVILKKKADSLHEKFEIKIQFLTKLVKNLEKVISPNFNFDCDCSSIITCRLRKSFIIIVPPAGVER